jgi:acetylornithine/succinyldiaminopimelate/putrescine aminotransferase
MTLKVYEKEYLGIIPDLANVEVARSKDSYCFDANGKKYVDFIMGWCVGNLGWENGLLTNAIKNFHGPSYVFPELVYKPWVELAELLAEITPGELQKSYRTTGGTEAVEAAMQIAMLYTKRHKFMSVEGSYHGNSIGTMSIGSSDNREIYPNLLPGCFKVEPPLDEHAVKKAETRLKSRDIAAFIMEPIICNLQVLIPEVGFMMTLQEICKKYGTLLVMDEVVTGFGRTGKMFASEHYNLEPDILCMAKAISNGHAPIGAVITTEKIADAIQEDFELYSTYGWHPLSVDVAITNIKYYMDNETSILNHVNEMEKFFVSRLVEMKFRKTPKIRSRGLAIAVDLSDRMYVKRLQQKCLEHGLIISAERSSLVFYPALNISRETAEEGLKILEQQVLKHP